MLCNCSHEMVLMSTSTYIFFIYHIICNISFSSILIFGPFFANHKKQKFFLKKKSRSLTSKRWWCLSWNLKMSMASESSWVGRKPVKRIGGMSDALSIAADLGFSVSPAPSQVSISLVSSNSHKLFHNLIFVNNVSSF